VGSSNQAVVTYGAGIYLALGFIGLMCTTFLNQITTLGLDTFLDLWAETILALVFAFVLLVSSFLIGSKTGTGSIMGGVLGTLCCVLGAIDALFLLSLTSGLIASLFPSNQLGQLDLSYLLLIITTLAVVLVGMPLVLVGSFQHLQDRNEGSP